MSRNIYGYVRVSTKDQHEDRQRKALTGFGVPTENIFIDKHSGMNFNRPAYRRLISKLRRDDVLVIKSIDRLGRNYSEIIEQWRLITQKKGAAIVVLDMPLLDTRRANDLLGTLITDIVLQVLAYVAETERKFIRQRQAEGIAAAKARGVKFGRAPSERPKEFDAVRKRWERKEISARAAGKLLGISHSTFLRWARK